MSWYAKLDKPQRSAFWACFGGWALDAMDVQMYALILPTLFVEWHMSKLQGGTLGTVAVLASSLGGIVAGNLADRYGRVAILQLSVVWFSLFTFISGFTGSYEQMLVVRALQGLGFGGEWAAGAVLVAEIVNPGDRGKVLGAISSGWAVGYGLAAVLFSVLFHVLPAATAWRVMFFIGILPAGLVVYIRRNIVEPVMYKTARSDREPRLRDIFSGGLARNTSVAWIVCIGVLGGNYTIQVWLPAYLQIERHLSYTNTGLFLLANIGGSFVGYLVAGQIADRFGRRWALALFAILGAASIYSYVLFANDPLAVLVLGCPLGFGQSGMNAVLAPLLSELFPTRLRATGQGFCYNAGRAVGSFYPALVGLLADRIGLTTAISIAASCAYAVVFVFSFALPDYTRRDLETLDPA